MSDYIPNELFTEILARLPVAPLFQFKSVCKSWYSLITSPSFVTKHLNQSITHSKRNGKKLLVRLYENIERKERYLLFNDDENFGDEYLELKFPFKLSVGYYRVVGCCNGLVCLSDDYFSDRCQIIIWNPSTRQSVTLPMAPKPRCPYMFIYGFGAHPITHEYKVIRIEYKMEVMGYLHLVPPKVEIYVQGTKSWRGISSAAPPYCIVEYLWSQVFVDGAVHWLAYDPCLKGGFRNLIMSFNIASELFSEIMLPPTLVSQHPSSLSIKLFGESLAVLCGGGRDGGGCSVWVLKEYGVAESWTKLFSTNLVEKPRKALGLRKNGELLLASAEYQASSLASLASYAPGTKTLSTTGIMGSARAFYVDSFMETLLLV